MKLKLRVCLALLVCGLTAPVWAGSVYVPMATDVEIDGIRYKTEVLVANDGGVERRLDTFFIPTETDGTERQGIPAETLTVNPDGSRVLGTVAPAGATGMLEISGAPQILVQARLVPVGAGDNRVGTSLPVVSSQNAFTATDTASVIGWVRSDVLVTDYVIVNLGQEPASCSIDLYTNTGDELISTAVIAMAPLGHRQFDDALGFIGIEDISAVRSITSCDKAFYVFARVLNRETGETAVLLPSSQLEDSVFQVPGEEPPPPPCPSDATCFSEPGTFFVPTAQQEVLRIPFPLDPGVYREIRVQMDVTFGNWWGPNTSGSHNIFWLARNRNRDLFGYVNVRGPNNNSIFMRHGIGQPQGQKPKVSRNYAFQTGATYRFIYTYDTRQNNVKLIVQNASGQELFQLNSVPDAANVAIGNNDTMLMDIGFPRNPAEAESNDVPTYGWQYKDLELQFIP